MNANLFKSDHRITLLASVIALTGIANAGIIVTRGHIVGGSATGTLVAIDTPYISNASATGTFGGPAWTTGGTTFAHQADQGFAAPSSPSGDGIREFDSGGIAWEPDGTPISEAKGYHIYPDGPSPGTTWTFNLATSGIDLPDGTIIHGVYARFGGRTRYSLTHKARYEFTEGAASGNVMVDQSDLGSAADLTLRWFDATGYPRDSAFQRIFSSPITVTGGNGFQLSVTDTTGDAGHIDAIVLDTSLPKANEPPAISTLLPVDDKSSVVPWTSLEIAFDEPVAFTGTGTVTITDLTDGSSTRVINLPNAQVTSPNGDDLLINPSTRLEYGTNYSVQISADALVDLATVPNAFPGILNNTTWNFSTRAVPNQLHNVLIVTCALADEQPSATTTRTADVLFNDPLNVDEAMRVASYGQIGLNLGDSSGLPATVQLSYPETVAQLRSSIGSTGLKNRMASSLSALGYNLSQSNFRFILYIQPESMSSGAAGWANLGANTSVYLSPIYIKLAMHEMGHCLGGNHSNGSDLGCSLGGADVDYNASKKIHYGWLNAFPGTVLTLPANTGTELSLVPLSRSPASMPGVRAVRVPNPNGGTSTYLVSYKINDGPYNTLQDSSYAQKVHVTEDTGGSATTHRATLGAGQEYIIGKLRVICNSVASDGLSSDVTIAVGNPILLSIADDVSGSPVTVGQPVNFTVTFDEAINATTIGTDDFENGGTAGITLDSITATANPSVFTVATTTTSPGNLNLRIKAGAVIDDLAGTPLLTQSPLTDNTTIVVNALAAPTLVSITDGTSGIPLSVSQSVNFTVSFNEAIKLSTFGIDDFENGATAGITVDSITATANPAIFIVAVTTTSEGNLRLQIKAGAIVEDLDGSFLNAASPLPDDTIISVKSSSLPLLLTIADNVPGGSITEGDTVTYTVTFDEAMNATTLGTDDFENGSSAEISVTSVTATANPAVFTVSVSTAFRGDLALQIKAAAVIQDLAGFSLITTSALPDDNIIAVNASPAPALLSINDNVTAGPITLGSTVNYTVIFDKAINTSTLGSDDFENGSATTITLSNVATTANPAVFTIAVTPTTSGSLNLRIKTGALIEDIYGLLLDTTSPLADNTTIAVFAVPTSLYWDANSTAAGAGSAPSGTWGISAFWNDNSTGGTPTTAFTATTPNADNLFFVAAAGASSGNSTTTITVSGAQVANSLNFQHSGSFTLSGGTSISLGNGVFGSGGININPFAYGSTTQGPVSITNTPVILNNSQTWTNHAAILIATGGLNLGNNTLTFAGTGSFSTDSTNLITGGGGGIIMNSSGKLTLGAANSPVNPFSGGLTINSGAVGFQNPASLGTGNINLNGGVLAGRFGSSVTRELGSGTGQIRITGGVSGWSGEGTSGSVLTITGTGSNPLVWGSAHFSPTEFVLQGANANPNGIGSFANNINLNGTHRTIRSNQSGASTGAGTFSGVISNSTGTAGLIKTGGGRLNLNGANTYNGGTTVEAGTLQLGNASGLGSTSGSLTVNGGLLNLQDQNISVGNLGGTGGTIANNGGGLRTLTIGADNGSGGNYQGVITNNTNSGSGTISLVKTGSGTITLSGSNSYTGGTTLSSGTLALGTSNTLPNTTAVSIASATLAAGAGITDTTGTLDVTSTATIDLGSGTTLAFANSSAIDWTGGTLNITGAFVFSSSLRFGTSSAGLTPAQLSTISVNGSGLGTFGLDSNGFLTADSTPPSVLGITDDKGGGSVPANTLVIYTIRFSEDMDAATLGAADFENAGNADISIQAITETSPGIFTVQVTPASIGTLQLQVLAGALLADMAGNPLNTAAAIVDDTILTVTPMLIAVPNVLNFTQASAASAITTTGLVVGTVTFQNDSSVPEGSVINQAPVGGASVEENSPVNLVISLGPQLMTVSFDANGGYPAAPASKQLPQGSPYGALATTARSGYSFTGWFNSLSGGTEVTTASTVTDALDHTLYAQWNALPTVNAGPDQRIAMSAPALWTPAMASTITTAWYDAADAGSLTLSGSTVSLWNDKSGNNRNATQASAPNRPTFRASDPLLNNLPSIGSTASAGKIGMNTPLMTAKNIYVVTYYKDGLDINFDGYSTLFSGPGEFGAYRVIGNFNTATLLTTNQFNDAGTFANGSVISSNSVLPMAASIFKFKSTAARTQPFSLGFNSLITDRDWQGFYSEWIFTDGSEDLATEQKLDGYLAHKWGLSTRLPANHPHKAAAPGTSVATASLDATASDTENNSLTHAWTMVSGPSPVIFANASVTDTTATFTAEGVYTLRLTTADVFGSSYDEHVITVTTDQLAFIGYISDPAFGLAAADQDLGDDPDGDRLTNGLEAWFGTHPGVSNGGLTGLSSDGMLINFTHPHHQDAPADLEGSYEWSPNLVDWYAGDGVAGPPDGRTVIMASVTTGATTTVTATASGIMQRIFVRARVEMK